ncbi:unnamed protein product [Timema podura]|uniref:GRHL1/CP2 C-terminal domain-containing protein n=1 Tax=Timema podura TaxID=61482 RepID=A0ABN7P1L4_TIMPD|nr:unnamed protein product [Timema podura]
MGSWIVAEIENKYKISTSSITNLFRKNRKGIIAKIDDDMLKYYCNEDLFLIEIKQIDEDEMFEVTGCKGIFCCNCLGCLVHSITGKGPYMVSLYDMGLMETRQCDCGEEATQEHVVPGCELVQEIRWIPQFEIQDRLVEDVLRDSTRWSFLDILAETIMKHEKDAYINRMKVSRPYRQRQERHDSEVRNSTESETYTGNMSEDVQEEHTKGEDVIDNWA